MLFVSGLQKRVTYLTCTIFSASWDQYFCLELLVSLLDMLVVNQYMDGLRVCNGWLSITRRIMLRENDYVMELG